MQKWLLQSLTDICRSQHSWWLQQRSHTCKSQSSSLARCYRQKGLIVQVVHSCITYLVYRHLTDLCCKRPSVSSLLNATCLWMLVMGDSPATMEHKKFCGTRLQRCSFLSRRSPILIVAAQVVPWTCAETRHNCFIDAAPWALRHCIWAKGGKGQYRSTLGTCLSDLVMRTVV